MSTEFSKTSFAPISGPETSILILGSLPGDKSIELNEYYGHPRNRFWRILSEITRQTPPITYADKMSLLAKTNIGVWDVAHRAIRRGSLDHAILHEEPNRLDDFVGNHVNLKVIGFNGKKAEALFDKYFKRNPEIRYVSLPSTSPANAAITFDELCDRWRQILYQ